LQSLAIASNPQPPNPSQDALTLPPPLLNQSHQVNNTQDATSSSTVMGNRQPPADIMDNDRLSAASTSVHITSSNPRQVAPTAPITTQVNPVPTTTLQRIEPLITQPSLPPVLSQIR